MRNWWHRKRYANCDMCGVEFRKGKGGGISRRTLCSNECWAAAWADWLATTSKGGKR